MKQPELFKLVTRYLHEEGFRRKGFKWYKATEECRLILELQKVRWSAGDFYINLLVQVLFPNDDRDLNTWDIRLRLSPYQLGQDFFLTDLLSLDNDIDDDIREAELSGILKNIAVPWLNDLGTVEGIGLAVKEGRVKPESILTPRVRQLAGIE